MMDTAAYATLFFIVFLTGLSYGGQWIVAQLRREAPTEVQTPNVRPTRLDVLRRRYVTGEIDVDQFETGVEALFHDGCAHEPEPPTPDEPLFPMPKMDLDLRHRSSSEPEIYSFTNLK